MHITGSSRNVRKDQQQPWLGAGASWATRQQRSPPSCYKPKRGCICSEDAAVLLQEVAPLCGELLGKPSAKGKWPTGRLGLLPQEALLQPHLIIPTPQTVSRSHLFSPELHTSCREIKNNAKQSTHSKPAMTGRKQPSNAPSNASDHQGLEL